MSHGAAESSPDGDQHRQRGAHMEEREREARVVPQQQRQIREARRGSDGLVDHRPQNAVQRHEPALHVLAPVHSLQLNPQRRHHHHGLLLHPVASPQQQPQSARHHHPLQPLALPSLPHHGQHHRAPDQPHQQPHTPFLHQPHPALLHDDPVRVHERKPSLLMRLAHILVQRMRRLHLLLIIPPHRRHSQIITFLQNNEKYDPTSSWHREPLASSQTQASSDH
ncbi:hypothetical protein KC19_5G009200 [Ceratodon purpureus]|uniref:Uncharacterized protein n=1 Tax=Ceratodon purpureus TaxID=3225 RepID=A0A8T0HXR7_CERPU|nr:hypothetical protein KC19_5G009200 [Ceratodon purpureus]